MTDTPNDQGIDTTEKLRRMVGEFRTAMLITRPGDGAPRGRPMSIAAFDDEQLWFVTSKETSLIEELEGDAGAAVTMQSARTYVALRGLVGLVDDTDKVRELWSETMRPWFPEGKTSPRIVLVRFEPISGEYWDMSGLQLVRLLYRAVKAYGAGERLEHDDPAGHARVLM